MALKREISDDVITIGLDASETLRAAEVLDGQGVVARVEKLDEGDGLRLYVIDGATAMPHVLRVLEGSGITLQSIELHRPSLDDVFLTKTGRSLREK